MPFRVAISTEPDPQGTGRVDIITHPYTTIACAAGVVTRTADRDSSRYRYSGIRKTRQLALGSEGNWVKSTHDAYENTWKRGELELYFSPSAGGCKRKKRNLDRDNRRQESYRTSRQQQNTPSLKQSSAISNLEIKHWLPSAFEGVGRNQNNIKRRKWPAVSKTKKNTSKLETTPPTDESETVVIYPGKIHAYLLRFFVLNFALLSTEEMFGVVNMLR